MELNLIFYFNDNGLKPIATKYFDPTGLLYSINFEFQIDWRLSVAETAAKF